MVWNCTREWPQIDLFLPVSLNRGSGDASRFYEYEFLFLRSLSLFWPFDLSRTSLNVIVDAEVNETVAFRELVATLPAYTSKITSGVKISLSPPSHYYRHGHDRQQRMMFWADNYTTAEYVGFVDTDCVFLTHIDREDLFEDGRPVVNGRVGVEHWRLPWGHMPEGTFRSTGILEPMRCMSYFPVIIKTAHLAEIRDFISKFWNMPFDQAFYHHMSDGFYSQFNIMVSTALSVFFAVI